LLPLSAFLFALPLSAFVAAVDVRCRCRLTVLVAAVGLLLPLSAFLFLLPLSAFVSVVGWVLPLSAGSSRFGRCRLAVAAVGLFVLSQRERLGS
jgi:hypothetical protein